MKTISGSHELSRLPPHSSYRPWAQVHSCDDCLLDWPHGGFRTKGAFWRCPSAEQLNVDPLSDVKALSEDSEPVESEVDIQLRHAVSEAMHEPSRTARWETVRFEAERGALDAAIVPNNTQLNL